MAILAPGDKRAQGLLLGLCLVAYLPGFFQLPPVDRDEARFAQTSRQMLEAQTWDAYVTPRIQDRPRLNKPLLTYWLQAAAAGSVAALPHDIARGHLTDAVPPPPIWPYRLPSLLAAIVAVLATAGLGRAMFAAPTGYLAAALLASTPMVAWEARQARADEVLLAFTVLAQWAVWSIWKQRHTPTVSTPTAALFWIAVALGVMTKGPVTPAVAAATVVCQSLAYREWRWLGRFHIWLGSGILITLVAPWVVLWGERIGWEVYFTKVSDEIVGRSVMPKEGHWGPPGYHLALLVALFWPGWFFLRRAYVPLTTWARRVTGLGADRGGPLLEAEAFCLAWILPGWLALELVQTKLPHYAMPLYPGLALLAAHAIVTASSGDSAGARLRSGTVLWLVIGATLVVGVPVATWAIGGLVGDPALTLLTLSAALIGGALLTVAARALRRAQFVRAALAGIAALVTAEAVVCTLLPHVGPVWLAPRVVRLVDTVDPSHTRPLAAVEFHEDSLVFLTAGRVQRILPSDLPAWLRSHPDGLAIVPREMDGSVPGLRSLGEAEGFNYSKGRWLHLRLVERATPYPNGPGDAPAPS